MVKPDVFNNQNFRNSIEELYNGVCSIFEFCDVFDENSKQTNKKEIMVLEDIPCRLCFRSKNSLKSMSNVKAGDFLNYLEQEIKLILSPDVDIKPGSKAVITQNGRSFVYMASGQPSFFNNHQEIMLTLFEKWC